MAQGSVRINVIGLRRSGNHAIIGWITRAYNDGVPLSNYEGSMDVRIPAVVDTFTSVKHNEEKSIYFFNDWLYYKSQIFDKRHPESESDIMLYSYEDVRLNYRNTFNHPSWINIVILRDPLNTMASRIRSDIDKVPYYIKMPEVLDIWKAYAKEASGMTNKLSNVVPILYNRWVIDEEYRKELAIKLGLPICPDTNYIPPQPSSFIGRKLETDPSRYNQRYKMVDFSTEYVDLLRDDELIKLNGELFPNVSIEDFIKGN